MCGDCWDYVPEDYSEGNPHPQICPLCAMPWIDMVKDVYVQEGLKEVIKKTLIRLINNKK
jgi:hypothetical protein